ncbi:endonuclease I family protein [Rheinheimera oceanensis]|jgi:deoxyribonuclease-1|uniref:endonuclease I family protein n=1 Tax=Rheinheimera oceanensis TaxID=2817449 RepID=UPI001BFCF005|nr:endonuclease [Rheinheimera oceanensis]
MGIADKAVPVNADRSNFNFTMLSNAKPQHGQCPVKIDFSARAAEPRDAIKGQIARIYFYMHDRYDLNMSRQQQQLLMAWDKQFPVTEWERERDRRIAKRMGHSNPFVTGERTWSLGHKNRAEGVVTQLLSRQTQQTHAPIEIKTSFKTDFCSIAPIPFCAT